ncbi:hypothetical protein Oscil6304_4381 [Oscillatoria acuminata PCC 6304]|uniref:Uncharacterized protein n=1 Tax=Oscillatoria acuminata PCC 6304 TaxID=56110 RepID=K9TP25_9CYAN|nr:hypothetical protein Oscil6304_4381 [Oscillatoria acuminata PCC 6304]
MNFSFRSPALWGILSTQGLYSLENRVQVCLDTRVGCWAENCERFSSVIKSIISQFRLLLKKCESFMLWVDILCAASGQLTLGFDLVLNRVRWLGPKSLRWIPSAH